MMSRTKRPRDGAISHFHRRMSCELFIFLLFIFVLTLKLFYFYSTGEEIFLFCSFGEKLCCLESCSKLLIFSKKTDEFSRGFLNFLNHSTLEFLLILFFSHFKNALKNCKRKFRKNFRYEKKNQISQFSTENLLLSLSRSDSFSFEIIFGWFALDIPSRLDDRLKSAINNTQKILRALRRSMSRKKIFFFLSSSLPRVISRSSTQPENQSHTQERRWISARRKNCAIFFIFINFCSSFFARL